MDVFLNNLAATLGLGEDPRIVYSLAAAALLALVSLVSGLGRLDAAVLLRPGTLLRFCAGVLLAATLTLLAQAWFSGALAVGLAAGLALVPLYLLALAYGPTVGLLAGALFAAATAAGRYPGWPEAILALELTVLGWLAISPSPRRTRWAGPVGAALAHALTLGTAGVAYAVWRGGQVNLAGLLAEQAPVLPGLVAAWALLALFGPGFYERRLPASRIAPRPVQAQRGATPVALDSENLGAPAKSRTMNPTLGAPSLERDRRPQHRRLVEHGWHSEDPNG